MFLSFSPALMLTARDLEFFSVVAKSRSLAAAARALDVSVSAVSQRLQLLESRLGVRLAIRNSRRIALTDEGQMLADRGTSISDELTDLVGLIRARRGTISGLLRVGAPLGFGRRYVAPAAAAFCALNPEITLELVVSDNLGGATESAWDVVIHIGELQDSTAVSHRLAPNERFLCASPAFVARHGSPTTPAELKGFDCIALRENNEDVTLWRFVSPTGENVAARVNPRLASNDGDIALGWALDGHGIVVRSEWSVSDDVRLGRLVRLLPNFTLPSADVLMLVGSRHGRAARTTAFIQYLRNSLQPTPWRTDR